MKDFSFKFFVVALAANLYPCLTFSTPLNAEDGNINQLTYVGTVEGKSYFAEENITLSWQDAGNFCNISGMTLATIKSVAQATVLNAFINQTTICHWTAGRLSLTPSSFLWNYDNEVLNSTVIDPLHVSYQPTCICLYPNGPTYYGTSCENTYKILCELRHG